MSKYDWSKFVLRIPVRAPAVSIYRAWSTSEGIESWFLRSAEYRSGSDIIRHKNELIQKGDRYTWLWHGYDDDVVEINDVLEANDRDMISFVFAGHCIVIVTIGMLHSETIVELSQENIPTSEEAKVDIHMGCMEGWAFYLANLKSILEGGIDLRNKNVTIGKMVNA